MRTDPAGPSSGALVSDEPAASSMVPSRRKRRTTPACSWEINTSPPASTTARWGKPTAAAVPGPPSPPEPKLPVPAMVTMVPIALHAAHPMIRRIDHV